MELKKKNWQQITINDYIELQDIIIREEAVDVEVGIVALLCGVDEDEIGDLTIIEYQRLRREAQFIASFPEVHNKAPKNITIGDTKYEVVTNMRKLTTAQYIDFQTYLKMGDGVSNLPNLLSVFIVPKGSKYGDKSYNIDKLKNDIKEYAFVVYYPTETDTLIYKSSIKVYCSVGSGYTVIGTNYRTLFKTTAPVKYINNIK